jgi:DNA helicase-2/ATP-dependent DNA helicase PcrA
MIQNRVVPWIDFRHLVTSPAPDGLGKPLDDDPDQEAAVAAPVNQSLQLIAGPGTGKTTSLTLRVLKLVFVDGVRPVSIVATTFTKKAAGELRSRILGWGDQLRNAMLRDGLLDEEVIRRIDLNQITTGTLDSIAEQVMNDFRAPGVDSLVPLEDFIATSYMRRDGLFAAQRYQNPDLRTYATFIDGTSFGLNTKKLTDIAREYRDRFLHDQIDVTRFRNTRSVQYPGAAVLVDAVGGYEIGLTQRLVTDFAGIEAELLARLERGVLSAFTRQLQVVLIDEYQDTNVLQEQIYFSLARAALSNGGSIVVVGDDDQSLYRFRGATVELFTDFARRVHDGTGASPRVIYLHRNYRSSTSIVAWSQRYATLDPDYQAVRAPGKPALLAARAGADEIPVLGMFRASVADLAQGLAALIDEVFNGNGSQIHHQGETLTIMRGAGGAVGDCALLCSSPADYAGGQNRRARLPLALRQALADLRNPIQVFNPRGETYSEVTPVARLCGLLLECCDPQGRVEQSIAAMPQAVRNVFRAWRQAANVFIRSDPRGPESTRNGTLASFVDHWQRRTSQGRGRWPTRFPLMELIYELLTWLPGVQDDAEGLLYLEPITRTVTAAQNLDRLECNIFRDQPWADRSVISLIRNVFEPIASGDTQIEEELIEMVPRDRLGVLSIHQAKGLEFPLTIVDVGSDFRSNHAAQRMKRFPAGGSRSHVLEDELWPFSRTLQPPTRSQRDRAFDDLIRQYFVAFSRPQDVLLLVGLGHLDDGDFQPNEIENVATGWTRDGTWPWRGNPDMWLI